LALGVSSERDRGLFFFIPQRGTVTMLRDPRSAFSRRENCSFAIRDEIAITDRARRKAKYIFLTHEQA